MGGGGWGIRITMGKSHISKGVFCGLTYHILNGLFFFLWVNPSMAWLYFAMYSIIALMLVFAIMLCRCSVM